MPVTDPASLPLFPLHAALVPGAPLGLRVFEARYLDMVAECGRQGTGFGICLILEGEEIGAPATPASVGVEARIEDFGNDRNGLLTLQVRGARRFRILTIRARDNGLLIAQVQWCEDADHAPLRPQHAALATLLAELLDKIGGEHPGLGHASANRRQLEQAGWVGWRLAELLPLSDEQRLALLQEDDPHQRLERLLEWMDED